MDILSTFLGSQFEFTWDYIVPFVLVLSVLVFVHEWGHYIVARWCKVKIETFSIGFGKELFGRTDKAGTRWKFSLVPLGGYVKMFGDVDPASFSHPDEIADGEEMHPLTEAERKKAFYCKPISQRAAIVFAGPAVNFIFAIIVLTGLYTFHGQPYTPPVAAGILQDSAADAAGMEPDDRIVEINGKSINSFQDIQRMVTINLDAEMAIVVERGDERLSFNFAPKLIVQTDRFGFKHSTGRLGIRSLQEKTEIRKHGVVDGFSSAIKETYELTAGTLEAVGQMIRGLRSPDEIGGIIRIGAMAGEFAQSGTVALITFMALLSVNLGLLNLFPIPLLDGGHLMFYAIEAVKGSPVAEQAQEFALRIGLAFLIGIMLFATWNDLVQLGVF